MLAKRGKFIVQQDFWVSLRNPVVKNVLKSVSCSTARASQKNWQVLIHVFIPLYAISCNNSDNLYKISKIFTDTFFLKIWKIQKINLTINLCIIKLTVDSEYFLTHWKKKWFLTWHAKEKRSQHVIVMVYWNIMRMFAKLLCEEMAHSGNH